MKKNKVYQIVTDRIIEKLESGVIPWEKPWSGSGLMPQNATNGREYSGVNLLLLGMSGFSDNRFLTFNQAKKAGGNVKKGEKSTPVIFWKLNFYDKETGRKLTQNQADERGRDTVKVVPILRYYNVFSVSQCENLDPEKIVEAKQPDRYEFTPIEAAEMIAANYPDSPKISHQGYRAFYRPATDEILMPERESFKSPEGYYSTLFHEMIHSTGHKSRLDRGFDGSTQFGDKSYSKEELTAEIGASFLNYQAGILDPVIENAAAYIQSWLKVLRDPKNTNLIVTAAAAAQKAADYILEGSDKPAGTDPDRPKPKPETLFKPEPKPEPKPRPVPVLQPAEVDLAIYNQICEQYFNVIDQLKPELAAMGIKLDSLKTEKSIFRPARRRINNGSEFKNYFSKEYLKLWDQSGIEDKKVTFKAGNFECSFPLNGIIEFKANFERDIISRKHHRYYVTETENKQAA